MDVPTAHAVTPCPGPSDGNRTTVYLMKSDALPRELLPDLCDYYETHLPRGASFSDKVAEKMKKKGAFAKIVFVGVCSMTEALSQVRRLSGWFFQRFAPPAVKAAEKRQRQARRAAIAQSHRRSRYNGRRHCYQQMGFSPAY